MIATGKAQFAAKVGDPMLETAQREANTETAKQWLAGDGSKELTIRSGGLLRARQGLGHARGGL